VLATLVLFFLLIHWHLRKLEARRAFNQLRAAWHGDEEYLIELQKKMSKYDPEVRDFEARTLQFYQLLQLLEFPIKIYAENKLVRAEIETALLQWKRRVTKAE
jgi:hypothetical protein